MGAGEEVAQVNEFAVTFVLDVNGAPAVLAAAHRLAVDRDGFLAADDGKWDDGLAWARSGGCTEDGVGGKLTLIWVFIEASSLSYSSFSYGYMRML